ncbi:hypothetical protein BYT27DRAFT_7210985 [Phlegmacium glaucopus]|nr:hypothetical protein BYT27DRAFT_7210985 [Phlegmacium glaucopus]
MAATIGAQTTVYRTVVWAQFRSSLSYHQTRRWGPGMMNKGWVDEYLTAKVVNFANIKLEDRFGEITQNGPQRMSNPDAPALNADGTLKDASEIEFCHSLSTQEQPLLPDTSKKRKRTTELDQDSDSDDTLPVKGNNASPKTRLFFKSNFTVGSKLGTPDPEKSIAGAGSSKLQSEGEIQVQLRQSVIPGAGSSMLQPDDETWVQPRQPTTRKHASAVLPSPRSTKHVRAETNHPKLARTTPAQHTDEPTDYTMQGRDDDSEDEESEGDESEDEDAVAKYNRMAEEIHCERWAPRKHNHRGHDDRTRDLRAAFTRATKEEGGVRINGHICNACWEKRYFFLRRK